MNEREGNDFGTPSTDEELSPIARPTESPRVGNAHAAGSRASSSRSTRAKLAPGVPPATTSGVRNERDDAHLLLQSMKARALPRTAITSPPSRFSRIGVGACAREWRAPVTRSVPFLRHRLSNGSVTELASDAEVREADSIPTTDTLRRVARRSLAWRRESNEARQDPPPADRANGEAL